jgi:hypothetical protein
MASQLHLFPPKFVHAANAKAYALGQQQRNGFHVRRIVWGRLLARAEKRDGEEIRRAIVTVNRRRP